MSEIGDMHDLSALNSHQMVLLLRAKAGELENQVLHSYNIGTFEALQADIALVAHILAAYIERGDDRG